MIRTVNNTVKDRAHITKQRIGKDFGQINISVKISAQGLMKENAHKEESWNTYVGNKKRKIPTIFWDNVDEGKMIF